MKMQHCNNCDRVVGHKRKIGIGTVLMILLTGGLWLLAIPAYAVRCIICGGTQSVLHKELGGGPGDVSVNPPRNRW
jgi:hypothetical protein